MKKILAILLAVALVASMAIPAQAVTPSYKIPEVPQTSKIKFDIKIELPGDFWENYFEEHPTNWKALIEAPVTGKLSRWKQ